MTIASRLKTIQQQINTTAKAAGRNTQDIHLIGVTKEQPVSAITEAYQAGLREFAENYWQEAKIKIDALTALGITWHFIGPLQSNKTAAIASHFTWVHSVCRTKIADLLASHRPSHLAPLNVCIQVNLDTETSKSGVHPTEIVHLAQHIQSLPQLKLRGLMAIPKPSDTETEQYESLSRLTTLLQHLNNNLAEPLDTLSMGMSHDYIAAVRAGSTLLRIGEALFGPRTK